MKFYHVLRNKNIKEDISSNLGVNLEYGEIKVQQRNILRNEDLIDGFLEGAEEEKNSRINMEEKHQTMLKSKSTRIEKQQHYFHTLYFSISFEDEALDQDHLKHCFFLHIFLLHNTSFFMRRSIIVVVATPLIIRGSSF